MGRTLERLAGKTFLLRIAAAGMTYVFVVFLARLMAPGDFGIVGALISSALLFSVLGSVGQRTALLRYVPAVLEAEKDPRDLVARSMRLALIGNLLVCILLVAAVVFAGHLGWEAPVWQICMGLLIVPLTGIIDMQAHLARSYHAVVLAILPKDVLWRFFSLAFLVVFSFVTGVELLLEVVLGVLIAVLALLILIQGRLMQRQHGAPGFLVSVFHRSKEEPNAEWRRSRNQFWITSVVALLFTNLDVIAAGTLINPDEAGYYFAANRLALVPGLFLISYNIVAGPIFSGHFSAGRTQQMRQVASKASLQVFVPTLVTVVLGLFLTELLLSLFGAEFVVAGDALAWLLVAALCNAAFGPNDLLLNMCGQEKVARNIALAGGGIAAVCILLGAATGDIERLAQMTCLGTIFARALSWHSVRRTLGFSADAFSAAIAVYKTRGLDKW